MHPIITAMFGATAGAASVFGNTPLDVVKTRMQVSRVTTTTTHTHTPPLRHSNPIKVSLCVLNVNMLTLFSIGSGGSSVQDHTGLCLPDTKT